MQHVNAYFNQCTVIKVYIRHLGYEERMVPSKSVQKKNPIARVQHLGKGDERGM